MKELPKRLLIVIPEWKERSFFEMQDAALGDFAVVSQDADVFGRWECNWIPSLVCLNGCLYSEGSEGYFQARRLDQNNALRS